MCEAADATRRAVQSINCRNRAPGVTLFVAQGRRRSDGGSAPFRTCSAVASTSGIWSPWRSPAIRSHRASVGSATLEVSTADGQQADCEPATRKRCKSAIFQRMLDPGFSPPVFSLPTFSEQRTKQSVAGFASFWADSFGLLSADPGPRRSLFRICSLSSDFANLVRRVKHEFFGAIDRALCRGHFAKLSPERLTQEKRCTPDDTQHRSATRRGALMQA